MNDNFIYYVLVIPLIGMLITSILSAFAVIDLNMFLILNILITSGCIVKYVKTPDDA